VHRNETADELARDSSAVKFVRPGPAWDSLGRIEEEGLDIGWLTSIRYVGKVLATPKNRLEN
jgi:hypothetical protein